MNAPCAAPAAGTVTVVVAGPAARSHFEAGDLTRAEELAQRVLDASPPDSLRARSFQLLAQLQGRRNNYTQAGETAARALAVAGSDERLRAALELEITRELARIGHPGASRDELTHAESRLAELACALCERCRPSISAVASSRSRHT